MQSKSIKDRQVGFSTNSTERLKNSIISCEISSLRDRRMMQQILNKRIKSDISRHVKTQNSYYKTRKRH